MATRLTIVLIAAVFFVFAIARAWDYENCWERFEDGSAYNHCTKEKQNVPW